MNLNKINPPKNFKTILWGDGKENHNPIPKIIWIFWDSKVLPPLVEICINKIISTFPDYTVNILNHKNLKNFLPHIHPFREDLPLANYSDLIRLDLLRNYGGIWMDASILVTENFDWIFKIKNDYQPEFVGFYTDFFSDNPHFPIVETWFIACPENSKFIKDWYSEFEKCYTSEHPKEYYHPLETEHPEYFQKIDHNLSVYLIAYIAAIKIMRENSNYRLALSSANDIGHYYNFNLQLTPQELKTVFLDSAAPKEFPKLIKFEKRGRIEIDNAINLGRYSKKSPLFIIANEKNYTLKKSRRLMNYTLFILNNLRKKIFK